MIAHDLGTLFEKAGRKTCIINHLLETGNRFCCAVVGFESNEELESAFFTEPIFGGVHLSWARLNLLSSGLPNLFKKSASGFDCLQLTRLYVKKNVSISCFAAFNGKLWAQVVSLASSSGGFPSGSGLLSGGKPLFFGSSGPQVDSLGDCLAVLEYFLEIFSDQVSVILKKLSFVDLVSLAFTFYAPSMAGTVSSALVVDLDMALDDMLALSISPLSGSDKPAAGLSLSGSKVLTSKVGSLESKLSALEALFGLILSINVPAKQADIVCWHVSSGNMVFFVAETKLRSSSGSWIRDKFDGVQIFTSGLDIGYLGTGIAVIMNNSLAYHVSKVKEVPGHLISIRLLFKGKLLVTILGLYAGAFPGTKFAQALVVNSLIAKAVNSSTFVILGGDFNKNSSGRSGVEKTIDFILVSGILSSVVVKHCVNSVSDFFNMDYKSVMILVGLGGLLDVRLNSLCKQTNKNHWKFRIKDADDAGWSRFKECSSAKMLEVKGRFLGTAAGLNLDAMWTLLEKMVVDSADEIFSRHWFCDFQCSKNKHSSKFLGLKLLVAKIIKCLTSANTSGFNQFVKKWSTLNASKALVLKDMVHGGQKVEKLLSYLLLIRKGYKKSKMFESKLLQETTIKKAIERYMEQFCSDKKSIIRNVLDWLFRKVVLDHLVVNNELILEPEEIRSGVDKIMKGWTWKHVMPMVLPDLWACQYASLNYVRDDAFSNVMNAISMGELLSVTNGLPDNKAVGLSGILNELWKHGCGEVLKCLLKRTWVSMISKPYDWDRTARKILSDCIFLACMFVVGSVVEDALEKNREIWLVLQDMWKAYDSVGWPHLKASLWHIKMCERFFGFFGNIHEDRINRVMTDFGLSDSYSVHNRLDQGEGLSKLSVSKAHFDVRFFVNVVFRKAITDKQFSYLVSAVLQPIVNYQTQFSFVSSGVCHKWNVMVRKGLKSKAGLPHDFLDAALHHPFLYGLKTFEQVQSEEKIAALVFFSNASGVLGHLFNHRFLDLQVLGWALLDPLQFPVKLHVSSVNNFLAEIVKIFLSNKLSLANNLPNAFCSPGHFPLLLILGSSEYFNSVHSLKHFGVAFGDRILDKRGCVLDWKTFHCWKKLDPRGPMPYWFLVMSEFMLV
ncbi:hypothetical protein G9A89_002726 [Geosiphon pyriformis]|nr:hypothetical protein G9A89_002726 [Geosiphon pyriformis]